MYLELQKIIKRCGKICEQKGWEKNWSHGGCYLHLEVSELIESLRGKGDSTPASETGDVLMALFSLMDYNDINIVEVIQALDNTLDGLESS